MAAAVTDRFETVAWVYNPSDLALLLSKFIQADIARWSALAKERKISLDE